MMTTLGEVVFLTLKTSSTLRKDVLEQKVRKIVEEIGLTRRIAYKVYFVYLYLPVLACSKLFLVPRIFSVGSKDPSTTLFYQFL